MIFCELNEDDKKIPHRLDGGNKRSWDHKFRSLESLKATRRVPTLLKYDSILPTLSY